MFRKGTPASVLEPPAVLSSLLRGDRIRRRESDTMSDAVICEPLRTPVGGFGGALRDVPAHRLGTTVVRALLERTGIAPEAVDEVILGHCYPTMEAPAIGRVVALDAGLPVTTTGYQLDRRCGSGLQAVLNAAMQVGAGVSDLVDRRRRRVDVERPALLQRAAVGGAQRARRDAARRPRSRPGHRRRRELPGARWHDRDRRERTPRVRHRAARSRTSWRCVRTSGPPPRRRPAGSTTRSSRSRPAAGSR